MLDWEGKLTTTLFLGGCNFRCHFCQNRDLVLAPDTVATVSWGEIEDYLAAKKDWIDGVVIGGGEPTIHKNLKRLIPLIKELDYPVKIDTNGSMPEVLKSLIQGKLVDFVALDVKTSFDKYKEACGVEVDTEKIKRSIQLILDTKVGCEFRTTVVPYYVEEEDVIKVAKHLKEAGAQQYVLQQFDPKDVLDPEVSKIKPYPKQFLEDLAKSCGKYIKTKVRGSG